MQNNKSKKYENLLAPTDFVMNEVVHVWMNEGTNERTNKQTKERTNERTNKARIEWMNEWMNECEGASSCRYQSIFDLNHPPNPGMKCEIKLEILDHNTGD